MKKFNKKGFTIVELVIVIAVIAILSAVLIPTFSNVIENANETAALQEAKNKLSAYVGYMGAEGKALNDGVVFIVENDKHEVDASYVYFKGVLRKFDLEDVKELDANALIGIPANKQSIKIAGVEQPLTHYITEVYDDEDSSKKEQLTYKNSSNNDEGYYKILFRWNTAEGNTKTYHSIQFDDGSKKCNIYGGLLVEVSNMSDAAKVDYDKTNISTKFDAIYSTANVTINLQDSGYYGSVISWSVSATKNGAAVDASDLDDYVIIDETLDVLKITAVPTAEHIVTVTANLSLNGANGTKEYTFTLKPADQQG